MLGRLRDAIAQSAADRRRLGVAGFVSAVSATALAIARVGEESDVVGAGRRRKLRRDRSERDDERRDRSDRDNDRRDRSSRDDDGDRPRDRGDKGDRKRSSERDDAPDREERRAALAEERQAARAERDANRSRRDDDDDHDRQQSVEQTAPTPTPTRGGGGGGGGGGGRNDGGGGGNNDGIVGGRAGEAADRLRDRADRLTGRGNHNFDESEDGIHVTRDPATGALTVQTDNIDYVAGGDGSMTVSTGNITFDQGPVPTPTPFPVISMPGRTPPAGAPPAVTATPSPEGGDNDTGMVS